MGKVCSKTRQVDGGKSPSHRDAVLPPGYRGSIGRSVSTGVEVQPSSMHKHSSVKHITSILDEDSDAICLVCSVQGVIEFATKSVENFGYIPASLVGKNIDSLVHAADLPSFRDAYENCASHPSSQVLIQFRMRLKDGEFRVVELTGHWICKFGTPRGLVAWLREGIGSASDVQALRQRSTSIDKPSELASERVMKYALHELRNAIHALDASANMIQEMSSEQQDEELAESIRDMMFAAKNTNVLVTDILGLIGMKEGSIMSMAEDMPIKAFLQDLSSAVAPLSRVPIHCVVDDNVPPVICMDVDHVSQVLKNGLINAVKFTDENKGTIYVCVSREESFLVFEVVDKGASLGDATEEQLMTALMKEETVRGARAQRFSLFLPICRMLVEDLMFGKVGVESVGGITRFWFRVKFSFPDPTKDYSMMLANNDTEFARRIPSSFVQPGSKIPHLRLLSTDALRVSAQTTSASLHEDKLADSQSTISAAATPAVRKSRNQVVGLDGTGKPLGYHVLLADDQRTVRKQAGYSLSQLGCTYKLLEDGDQVEDALRESNRPFDAIVLDILMHRSDGAKVCQNLRDNLKVKGPIIAMTSQTEARDVQRYYQMGFDVVLPKPFTRSSLGKALVEGQQRRGGNTKFARMSARIDEDRQPGSGTAGLQIPEVVAEDSMTEQSERHEEDDSSFLVGTRNNAVSPSIAYPEHVNVRNQGESGQLPGRVESDVVTPFGSLPRRNHYR